MCTSTARFIAVSFKQLHRNFLHFFINETACPHKEGLSYWKKMETEKNIAITKFFMLL